MVAQDVKSTTGRHSKRLFINRSITVELKKYAGISAVFIGRDHRADAPSPGPQKSSQANPFQSVFRMQPQNRVYPKNKFTRALMKFPTVPDCGKP